MQKTLALIALLIPALASAEDKRPTVEKMPPGTFVAEHAQTAQVLYFNRCRGGCTITSGSADDARTHVSTIPRGADGIAYQMTEFKHSDAVWDAMMTCLREVYSPYNIQITDQPPAPGVAYNENIVAGTDNEINYGPAGGVSPVTGDCSPFSYVISYSFANGYGPNPLQLCYVAAQETGHSFGMADHSFEFISDGRSACSDPMSYRSNCLSNGQRFFRNEAAFCGDFAKSTCNCAGMNSHLKLIAALGPGTSIIPAPALTMKAPLPGPIQAGAVVTGNASSKRGVSEVELWLNGWQWGETKGVPFTATNQPATDYTIPIPGEVPDGVIDIVMIAKDDIGVETKSPVITVTKGAACATADSCLPGMKCEAGKCFWEPAVGEIGDKCTYPQFCTSGICLGEGDDMLCTKTCVPGTDSCPEEYECIASGASGACFPKEEKPGCGCTAGSGVAAQSGLLALGFLLVLRRRRKR
ncbi:MAG: MYXO-CTERM sorting domain-containing protein [Myxococcota bacterium]|nr:MYXO-CTERM sorting domain-containing protein [Myxococcota bacterium]